MAPPHGRARRDAHPRRALARALLLGALVALPAFALAQPFPCLPASACPAWTQDLAAVDLPGTLLAGPDGTVFHARLDRENATSPTDARDVLRLVRLDAATDATRWSVKVDRYVDPIQLLLSGDGARVHALGTENVLGVHRVAHFAFDVADGALAWNATAAHAGEARAFALSPDGASLAVAGVRERGTRDAWVSLWNASNGTLVWQRTLDGGGGHDTRLGLHAADAATSVAFDPDGTRLYAAGTLARAGDSLYDGLAWALDAANGTDVWRVRTGTVAQAQHDALATDGARVYAAGSEGLYAFDADTGAIAWAPLGSLPACARADSTYPRPEACRLLLRPDGALFFRASHALLRIDAATGLPRWAHAMRLESSLGHGATVDLDPTGATLAVVLPGSPADAGPTQPLTQDVEMRLLDAETGRLLQRAWLDTGHPDRAHVARFAGGHVVATGTLSRLDTSIPHAFLAAFGTTPLT